MLTTIFGVVRLMMDGKPVAYTAERIENMRLFPDVDGAYRIRYDFCADCSPHELSCVLDGVRVKGGAESGEGLEAVAFYQDGGKLTLGCEGDFGYIEAYDYDGAYLPDGLKILIRPETKSRTFLFGVAWLDHCTEENDVQTWLAADPTVTA